MKKTSNSFAISNLVKGFALINLLIFATIPCNAQQKSSKIEASKFSILAGYGTHGFTLRGDCNISELLNFEIPKSSTRVYLDFGASGKTFANSPNFKFNGINYSSDVSIFDIGIGFAQEFLFAQNHISLSPYIGARYENARFKDKALVNAIGTNGMDRTWGGVKVGPTVENGYGGAATVDVGVRVGYKISKVIELTGNFGFSPIKYGTSNTLFGQYWGEAPNANPYYINRSNLRMEGGLKFNF